MKISIRRLFISLFMISFCAIICFPGPVKAASQETGPVPDFDKILPDLPKMPETTTEPVLLRYKFLQGKTVRQEFIMMQINQFLVGDERAAMGLNISVDSQYSVKAVDDKGDANAAFTITRLRLEAKGPNSVAYDSAKADQNLPSGSPHLKSLDDMINVPIPVRVSATGKILDIDLDPMHKVIQKAGAAAQQLDLARQTDEMVKNTFVMLAAGPVKMGDIYDAGNLSRHSNSVNVRATVRYKVSEVSADKQFVVLEPVVDMNIQPPPQQDMTSTASLKKFRGWIVFDTVEGSVAASGAVMTIEGEMKKDNQAVKMLSNTVFLYREVK